MDYITELIKILVPAALVMYAMYLVTRNFLQKQFEKQLLEVKSKTVETVLPLRLQAYERLALLLERISPNNMLLRLSDPSISAFEFQQLLQKEIREEVNHNLSQQVYVSDDAWKKVKGSINDIVAAIQKAGETMTEKNNAIDLAEAIFDLMIKENRDPVAESLSFIKAEARQLM
ncbi:MULTISPECIES: hypothetical protein [Roseivirga]|jgi:CRISPR/Cas system CMR subunit Cmr4 (Cas7 group RAMP superfamily)|uniref:Uncharacterized protein n=2 Tax=Roseivirga TaxID=290180 RepID=A0ABQ3I8J8_9BACT|nr:MULTISPECIES: hypothetical protein [Roseivirga]MEC7752675.1 hypothetical protein [Bacteroidota bacterium]GHE66430.1 hypothetical protein GCM10011340_22170 [Roseivirga thermotolerans]|tara:strand:+ start:11177 stop:11698 length:522 start_codon:yes stop_codon:yes gene_type:complete